MDNSIRVEIVKQFLKRLTNKRTIQHYDDFLHQDVIIHDSILGEPIEGLQNAKRIDIDQNPACQESFTIEEVLEHQDRVIVRWVSKGKFIRKVAPPPDIFGLSIFRFQEQKITEIWHYWDRLALLGKLGKNLLKVDMPKLVDKIDVKSIGDEKEYVNLRALLTNRERDCLKGLVDGKTAKDTAEMYGISARTVESYFEKIKEKFKCPTKRDLFKVAKVLEELQLL